ncbi:MAG: hypothetical protein ACXAC8_02285 [Candidatus Hodarchaeales archaeon]|jgi:hypothetical protein
MENTILKMVYNDSGATGRMDTISVAESLIICALMRVIPFFLF